MLRLRESHGREPCGGGCPSSLAAEKPPLRFLVKVKHFPERALLETCVRKGHHVSTQDPTRTSSQSLRPLGLFSGQCRLWGIQGSVSVVGFSYYL